MICINLNKFPRVKQSTPDWCIPASIENVMKYYGENVSQVDIVIDYIQKFTSTKISLISTGADRKAIIKKN